MSQTYDQSQEEEEYQVEQIIDKRVQNGQTEYQVKWQGYPASDATWEPIDNLKTVMSIVMDYENRQKQKEVVVAPPPPETQQGNYEDNDSAEEITQIKKDADGNSLHFQVTWKKRKGNQQPKESWLPQNLLKQHNPEILIDYLLKKIKWPTNK